MNRLETFIDKIMHIHGDKYDYSLVKYINNKTKVKIVCKKHGIFEVIPNSVVSRGCGCQKCARELTGLKNRNINWKIDFVNIHGNKYDYSKVNYVNNRTNVEIICKVHGSFFIKPNSHVSQKQGCRKCGMFKVTNNTEFIIESNKIYNNRYEYYICDYINSHDMVNILCKKHGSFLMRPNDHLSGQGCPKCGKENMSDHHRKDRDVFIEECKCINGDFYDYSLVSYKNNKTDVNIICPYHGIFSQSPKTHLRGDGCSKCNSSKGERKIISLLESKNIDFEFQYFFETCVSKKNCVLKFDFYLPNHNICIEYDGEQHFKSVEYFGGESAFIDRIERDEIKNNFCHDNNIKLIRIPFSRFNEIEKILTF